MDFFWNADQEETGWSISNVNSGMFISGAISEDLSHCSDGELHSMQPGNKDRTSSSRKR